MVVVFELEALREPHGSMRSSRRSVCTFRELLSPELTMSSKDLVSTVPGSCEVGHVDSEIETINGARKIFAKLLTGLLSANGFTCECFLMANRSRLALAITWNEKELFSYAEATHYPVLMDDSELRRKYSYCKKPNAYFGFDTQLLQYVQRLPNEAPGREDVVFLTADRIQMLWSYLQGYFDVSSLFQKGFADTCYFPHQKAALDGMREHLTFAAAFRPSSMPIEQIKDYFGVQTAFYFAFTEHCYQAALVLTVMAAFADCVWHLTPTRDADVDYGFIGFCLFMIFVCIAFMKTWLRRRNHYLIIWGVGQTSTQIEKPLNVHFVGRVVKDEAAPNRFVRIPHTFKRLVGTLCAVVLDVLFLVTFFLALYYVHDRYQDGFWIFSHDIVVTLLIRATNLVWSILAPLITRLEEHKYAHEFDERVDIRLSIVGMITWFMPLCLQGFVALYLDMCPSPEYSEQPESFGCWRAMEKQFYSYIVVGVVLGLLDPLMPLCTYVWRTKLAKRGNHNQMSYLEQQYNLDPYDGQAEVNDYSQLVWHVAYVLVLGQANWMATSFSFFLLTLTKRWFVLWKLLHVYRRPLATVSRGIGDTRRAFLQVLAHIGCMSNWAAICFFARPFASWSRESSLLLCLIGFWVLILIYKVVDGAIPDLKNDDFVLHQRMKWQRFYIQHGMLKNHAYRHPTTSAVPDGHLFEAAQPLARGDRLFESTRH
eukprot:TRINITY_DN15625_c0_g1_i2.p1 TRINITY_DN15625_c0_g1~~TRINITY_DN15625_c0_g1_i2.p1  ORF type:complete len:777 (+),score=112.15 TRINITY_DN15625_c0_g1_i2:207-2333(+)